MHATVETDLSCCMAEIQRQGSWIRCGSGRAHAAMSGCGCPPGNRQGGRRRQDSRTKWRESRPSAAPRGSAHEDATKSVEPAGAEPVRPFLGLGVKSHICEIRSDSPSDSEDESARHSPNVRSSLNMNRRRCEISKRFTSVSRSGQLPVPPISTQIPPDLFH